LPGLFLLLRGSLIKFEQIETGVRLNLIAVWMGGECNQFGVWYSMKLKGLNGGHNLYSFNNPERHYVAAYVFD
jgi:hypothetical protein